MTRMLAQLLLTEGIGVKIGFVREQNLAAAEFHVVAGQATMVGTYRFRLTQLARNTASESYP